MNQIVKAETAPTMSQATTSASVFIALVVILASLGMAAALQVGSVASAVLAVVVALTALIVSPALLSIARTRAWATAGRVSSARPSPASVAPPRCRAFSLHKHSTQQ